MICTGTLIFVFGGVQVLEKNLSGKKSSETIHTNGFLDLATLFSLFRTKMNENTIWLPNFFLVRLESNNTNIKTTINFHKLNARDSASFFFLILAKPFFLFLSFHPFSFNLEI